METVKIIELQVENCKKVQAIKISVDESGLYIVGGNNAEGKTTLLDMIMFALGGDKHRPSNIKREGSNSDPYIKITLNNGFIVERKGKNSALKVSDPNGAAAGQTLLNKFISQFALDVPKFLKSTDKEKSEILLQIIGVGDQLAVLDKQEKELYNERLIIGRDADRKSKYAEELDSFEDVPSGLVTAGELIQQQQKILLTNAENSKKRDNLKNYLDKELILQDSIKSIAERLKQENLALATVRNDIAIAETAANNLQDESTTELENQINSIEETNVKVRANIDKRKAIEESRVLMSQYEECTYQIEKVRTDRMALLNAAELPLEGLSIDQGELTYNAQKWDCMSASEHLKVSAAIVRKLNPNCGFVLLDKLEQMDNKTLKDFSKWLIKENLQVIGTRVSTGSECSIIIEEGMVVKENKSETNSDWNNMEEF